MRLVNFEADNIQLALHVQPVGFAIVEIKLMFYVDESETTNILSTKVRISASDQDTISEIQERALAEARETLRLASNICADTPLAELLAFRNEVWPPD